jgi:transcriptional regulator with XRE-family HTH domain
MEVVDIVEEMRRVIAEKFDGSQKKFAESCGISATYISDVLLGKRSPGDKVLAAIGYRTVVSYEKIED